MGKVYQFCKDDEPFHEFLDKMKEAYDKDLTNNFVCIWSRDFTKEEKKDGQDEGFVERNIHYWYGTSSTSCLGLLKLMEEIIMEFIRENSGQMRWEE